MSNSQHYRRQYPRGSDPRNSSSRNSNSRSHVLARNSSKRNSALRVSASRVGAYVQNWIHSHREESAFQQGNAESEEGEPKLPPVLNKSQIEARIHDETFSQAMHEAESIKFTIWDYGGQAVSVWCSSIG